MKLVISQSQFKTIINEHIAIPDINVGFDIEEQIEFLVNLKRTRFLYSSNNEDIRIINGIIKNLRKVQAMTKSR